MKAILKKWSEIKIKLDKEICRVLGSNGICAKTKLGATRLVTEKNQGFIVDCTIILASCNNSIHGRPSYPVHSRDSSTVFSTGRASMGIKATEGILVWRKSEC